MKTFNPEKELRKIQKGNKNKVIISVIALLLIIAIGSSYALYQIRYSKQIIYTTVAPFYSKDIQISLYVDGEKDTTSDTFPTKESGKIFSHVTCENGSSGVFDNTKWELDLKITKQDKCNVYFVTGNLPNAPELYQGMIPVVYDEEGNIYVADTESDWYNYQDHRWGNAVLVDNTKEGVTEKYFNGTELKEDIAGAKIPMEEILQMYVWVPRYKYKIFSLGNTDTPKQIIEIAFEKDDTTTGDFKCTYQISAGTVTEDCPGIEIGKWYTHPAFTFKGTTDKEGTELKGIWVGKFESSDPQNENGRNINVIGDISILPNKTSMVSKSVSTIFYTIRDIEERNSTKYNLDSNTIDTHLMKNIEWGAMAYLTQSIYGVYTSDGEGCVIEGMNKNDCEVWINNTAEGAGTYTNPTVKNGYGGTATGCVAGSMDETTIWNPNDDASPVSCSAGKKWNESGIRASTTGNMYGIYDTSGGTHEYVMGAILQDGKDTLYLGSSGFILETNQQKSLPDAKYYDVYTFDTIALSHERGHYGDATKEILQIYGNDAGGWNSDTTTFPSTIDGANPWFRRGRSYTSTRDAGIFAFHRVSGSDQEDVSFRVVLTAQDGNG